MIDYRSDTVTRPTSAMLERMHSATVGDDVFGEDPETNALERESAELFGMEAGIFCPSGTMTNQIAIKVHTQPADEVICEQTAHVYQYEGGGIAFHSGASVKLLAGDRGRLNVNMLEGAVNPDDVHKPRTSLVCLENTSNRGGGSCYTLQSIREIRRFCDANKLKLHLDGARIFNALIATGTSAADIGREFHSISICLSKGLGAPVGSVLLGEKEFIKQARRVRKLFGGGMRQAGYLAAAGRFALQHHIERLVQDHEHARIIASALHAHPTVSSVLPVETNIIIFELAQDITAVEFVRALAAQQILGYAIGPRSVRLVLHLDITASMVQQTVDALNNIRIIPSSK